MLAVDTNVVVRYLIVTDNPDQSAKAQTLIDHQATLVSLTVLLEVDWVLRATFNMRREDVADALEAFAGLPHVQFEEQAAVLRAIAWSRAGLNLADALHLVGSGDASAFMTFDKRLAKRASALGLIPVRSP